MEFFSRTPFSIQAVDADNAATFLGVALPALQVPHSRRFRDNHYSAAI
jgi:hypothetical protein